MFLERIVAEKQREIEILKKEFRGNSEQASALPPARDFVGALKGMKPAIIAEIKRASPSRGRLVEDLSPGIIARTYEKGKAAAVSVLTERRFFEGDISHLTVVRNVIDLPILRKDFILHPLQILEARLSGADAVLLIARIISGDDLGEFIRLSRSLGLAPLVEVDSPADLRQALSSGADLIGINNRDLETFQTDISKSINLAALVPEEVTLVSESGITKREDIETLMDAGIHAFLIGEALITAADPAKKLAELRGDES